MSGKKQYEREKRLKEDKIVESLIPPELRSKVEKLKTFIGLLGKSSVEGYWRIYTTLEFNDYMEVSEKDIVFSYQLENELNPIGGTIVWVNEDAKIENVRTASKDAKEFLEGDITSRFLSQTGTNPGLVAFWQALAEFGNDNKLFITPTWTLSLRFCTRIFKCGGLLEA